MPQPNSFDPWFLRTVVWSLCVSFLFATIVAVLCCLLVGCAALSPTQGPGAQQGAVNVGEVGTAARNISPDTTVTAGHDQQVELALQVLAREQEIRASEGSHVSAPSMTQGLDGWDVAILAFGVALAATLGHVVMMLANRLTRRWFPDPRDAPMQTARPTPPP